MTTPRLGEYLREARERAGLSLEQLADRTRVRLENLVALERENLDSLPADTYVRGFVKIVCRELRLPPEEGLALYSNLRSNSGLPEEISWAEEDATPAPGTFEKAFQDPDRVIRIASRAKKWAIPVGALLVIGAVFLLVKIVGSIGGDAAQDPPAVDTSAVPANESSAPAEVPKASDSGVATPVPGTRADLTPEGRGRVSENVPTPAAEIVAPSVSTPSTSSPAPETGDAASNGAALDTVVAARVLEPASPSPVAKGPIVLEIEALREAEVTLVLDGSGFPRKRSLMAGERKSWKADSVFVLSASDGGAIRLKLDGADLGAAGADGATITNLRVRK